MSVARGSPGWLLLLAAGAAGWGQAAQTSAEAGPVETKSGVLRAITATEADVDASDAQGKPKEFVFARDAATKCDAVKAGDHVNVIYVAHGETYTAVRIVLAGVTTPGQAVPLQGVYGVASAQPVGAATSTTVASMPTSPPAPSKRTTVTAANLGRQVASVSTTTAGGSHATVGIFGNKTSGGSTATTARANEVAWETLLDQAKASGGGVAEVSALLELEPGNTLATRADAASPARNTCTYKDGRFTCSSLRSVTLGSSGWTGLEGPQARTAEPGEGLTLKRVAYLPEGVVLDLTSGAATGRPFYATVKVPFEEGKAPSNEVLAGMLPQLLKVYSLGSTTAEAAAAAGSSASSSAAAPGAEGAPSGVPSIKVGMTTAEVTGVLGQPEKIVNLGAKVVYFYPQMKATFVDGKLTDVE